MSRKDDLKASEQFSKGSALRHKEHQYDLEAAQEVAEAEVTPRPAPDEPSQWARDLAERIFTHAIQWNEGQKSWDMEQVAWMIEKVAAGEGRKG